MAPAKVYSIYYWKQDRDRMRNNKIIGGLASAMLDPRAFRDYSPVLDRFARLIGCTVKEKANQCIILPRKKGDSIKLAYWCSEHGRT